ncbi:MULTISPECIES: DUF3847 domain-containing protein [Bacillota]|uniref:DUF3847 domain-containing protein n=2 Tax=Bacillota TaxID=1239 RepID=UPI000B22095A|nr:MULTISPECIES: DUF3847 domain-containing protein [Bacillota]
MDFSRMIPELSVFDINLKRTHSLITRGAILESLIENVEDLTDEEIKILEKQQRQKNLKKHLE